jgi:tRNA(Arg) A34 adenosine deaminase TadA
LRYQPDWRTITQRAAKSAPTACSRNQKTRMPEHDTLSRARCQPPLPSNRACREQARERGDNPFGAVLVGEDGRILAECQNTQNTERDVTGHAETNLLRDACRLYDPKTLAASTLYSSGEPCAMCSGTIFWSGVGRVFYGMSSDRLYELFPRARRTPSCGCPAVRYSRLGQG